MLFTVQSEFAGGQPHYDYLPANGNDAFIVRLNPQGNALTYATYLGGTGDDIAYSVALDPAGAAYVAGTTGSINFPTTPGVIQPKPGGGQDVFVAKLSRNGRLVYSTYLGGSDDDGAVGIFYGNGASGQGRESHTAIAVDAQGDAYVTGSTLSADFPTYRALQPNYRSGRPSSKEAGYGNAFITRLNPNASAFVYSTYLGGSGGEDSRAIALGADGDVYIAGRTWSSDFPTKHPLQGTNIGVCDAKACDSVEVDMFVARISDPPRQYSHYFSETGHTVSGSLYTYWDEHGGLAQFGYPLSDAFSERSPLDGRWYLVQYFEYAELELHPENPPPYNVEVAQLGSIEYRARYPNGAPNQQPFKSDEYGSYPARIFSETGKTVGGSIGAYWQAHGGLITLGYPISEEFPELSASDHIIHTVQYFERAIIRDDGRAQRLGIAYYWQRYMGVTP